MIAVPGQEREQGRFRGSIERERGAAGEQRESKEGAPGEGERIKGNLVFAIAISVRERASWSNGAQQNSMGKASEECWESIGDLHRSVCLIFGHT